MKTVPLVGYSSALSGRSGDQIDFKVSSEAQSPYQARLFRSICADPNPAGAGLVEHACDDYFPVQSFASRKQRFCPGSHAVSATPVLLKAQSTVSISVRIFPTMTSDTSQAIMSFGQFSLNLTPTRKCRFASGGRRRLRHLILLRCAVGINLMRQYRPLAR